MKRIAKLGILALCMMGSNALAADPTFEMQMKSLRANLIQINNNVQELPGPMTSIEVLFTPQGAAVTHISFLSHRDSRGVLQQCKIQSVYLGKGRKIRGSNCQDVNAGLERLYPQLTVGEMKRSAYNILMAFSTKESQQILMRQRSEISQMNKERWIMTPQSLTITLATVDVSKGSSSFTVKLMNDRNTSGAFNPMTTLNSQFIYGDVEYKKGDGDTMIPVMNLTVRRTSGLIAKGAAPLFITNVEEHKDLQLKEL